MALEISAARVVNTVEMRIDRESFKRAKQAIKGVADYANNQKIHGLKFDKTIANARKAQDQIAKVQAQRTNKSVQGVNKQAAADKQAARDAAKAAKRAETADIKRQSTLLQLNGIMGRTADEERTVAREAMRITEAFKNGQISVQRMNMELRESITLTRRAARARAGANPKATAAEGGWLRSGALGAAAVGGLVTAGGAMAMQSSIDTVRSTTERNNAVIQGAKQVNTNPNSILALAAWGKANGVDSANNEKIQDNLKDVRERLGESIMNTTQDPKTGKYKGGNAAVNAIQNQFGWSTDQIKQYQNNPLDFIGATVNAAQGRGMNEAQIGNLLENLGDDLSYYTKAFANGGEQYRETLDKLIRSGAAIDQEMIDATATGAKFNQALDLASQGMSNEFTKGFFDALGGVEGFEKAMTTVTPVFRQMGEAVGDVVKQFKNAVDMFHGIGDWWKSGSELSEKDKQDISAAAYNAKPYVDPNTGIAGADPAAVASASAANDNLKSGMANWWDFITHAKPTWNGLEDGRNAGTAISNIAQSSVAANLPSVKSGLTAPAGYSPTQIINQITIPSDILKVNITPDGTAFGNAVKTEINTSMRDFEQGLTLSLNSSTSATGSN